MYAEGCTANHFVGDSVRDGRYLFRGFVITSPKYINPAASSAQSER